MAELDPGIDQAWCHSYSSGLYVRAKLSFYAAGSMPDRYNSYGGRSRAMSKFVPLGQAVGESLKDGSVTVIARILGGVIAGLSRVMGMGLAPATCKLGSGLCLTSADFGIVDLKDAFASQGVAVLRKLRIAKDAAHVDRNGGAIALGHLLGIGSARIAGAASTELSLSGERRALATNGIGAGQYRRQSRTRLGVTTRAAFLLPSCLATKAKSFQPASKSRQAQVGEKNVRSTTPLWHRRNTRNAGAAWRQDQRL